MRNEKLIIPTDLREEMIERIHQGHLRPDKCIKRAKQSIWWPEMQKEIKAYIEKCNGCIIHRRTTHPPMKNADLPDRPWECVGTDLLELRNRDYLLVVDYYSRWIEVVELANKARQNVVKGMKGIFARYGVPKVVRSDNGPCYKGRDYAVFTQD